MLRYPTKPVSMAVQVATVSVFTYLQGSPPMDYEQVVRETLSGEVPQVYTTIKTEQQAKEIGWVSSVLAHAKPLFCHGNTAQSTGTILQSKLFRFPWYADFIESVINSSLRVSPNVRPDYKLKFIQVPNRYWKEPTGYPRARPIGRGKEHLDHQLRHLDVANVPKWIGVAAQILDRNLSRRMAPLQYEPASRPQGRMTMSGGTVGHGELSPRRRNYLEVSIFEV